MIEGVRFGNKKIRVFQSRHLIHFRPGNGLLLLHILFPFIFSWQMMAQSKNNQPGIVYEVFIQSFCDSNGDGTGDIPGLISKLGYIKDLGATSVWIMPVHPSPSYHKYDITDYFAIHPDYGTMKDMEKLISETHKLGMKLILDLVVNHTSSEHPWFKEAVSSPDNPYHNYYVWRDLKSVEDELNKKETTFDSDNITQWHQWADENDRYYAFFWKGMPDLNFDNPAVREEVYKIGKFWLDKGIDGFRLDAARHIYPDDRFDDTRKFWEEFRTTMVQVHPDVIIVGEVWSDPKAIASLFNGIPSLFNFELTRLIPDCIVSENAQKFISGYTSIAAAYQSVNLPYQDAILLSNHDMNRVRSTLGGEINKTRLAASILLTLPGVPYLYYGEEIGMLGMKPDEHIREPFLWSDDGKENTWWVQSVYSIPGDVPPLDQQKKDPESIYHYYKKWIKLREEHPVLSNGQLEFVFDEMQHVLSYTLTNAEEKILVIHNLSNDKVEVKLPEKAKIISDKKIPVREHKFDLQGKNSVLVEIQ